MRVFSTASVLLVPLGAAFFCFADDPPKPAPAAARPGEIVVQPGTHIPLSMINSVSTKNASEGDRVYLETVFPIMVNGRMTIPPGSYVAGTITQVKRPGRVKGRGELFLRFDSLTLPNGVTRDFRASVGALDGRANEKIDRNEGKIQADGSKGDDARVIAETTGAGTSVGALAGSAAGHAGMGAGIGAAAGAAAGLMGVLLTRGQEAVLAKGTTIEMVLDRPIYYDDSELPAGPITRRTSSDGDGPPTKPHSDILHPRTPSPMSRLP